VSRPTQFGEAFVGDGVNAAHLNTVLGAAGGPVETAWVSALATPRQGFAAFVAAAQPGLALRPFTLFVNKAAIEGEEHGRLTWGAAQAGVAGGVIDAVAEGTIDPEDVLDLLLIAAVWVNPAAADEGAVYANNRQATLGALRAGREGRPTVAEVLAVSDDLWSAFFRSR
jgi:5,6,7,8-tetrahydromethanopterin hydro-lyase